MPETVRHRLAAYDSFLIKYRSWVALGFTVVAVSLGTATLLTLFNILALIGLPSTSERLSVEVQALLATGTLALAYAALVSAISSEKLRYWSVRPFPLLTLRKNDEALLGRAVAYVTADPRTLPVVEISNAGPGHAIGLQAKLYIWTVRAGPTLHLPAEALPTTRAPDSQAIVVDYRTMGPSSSETFAFEIGPTLHEKLLSVAAPDTDGPVAIQLIVGVKAKSVLSDIPPPVDACGLYMTDGSASVGGGRGATWRVMSNEEVLRFRTTLGWDKLD